ncbi:MAG TPA: DotA/TraY family protein [Alphaproteobacteria bacterium]|nr:DotA/TraY family protein [Alphaproteobacteria bacterium]
MKVVKYALLPQILPRMVSLFFSGFSFFAYFIAQVYAGVRLLPKGHPFLNSQNIGHFSIPDVIGAAGRGLKYRKENIDQVIIFYVILMGLILMTLQVLTMAFSLLAPQAIAVSLTYYFGNSGSSPSAALGIGPSQDLAFILLDRVFGVPGVFNSCVSTATPCYRSVADLTNSLETVYKPAAFPWPFHNALHVLYEFYSIGLLVIALFIVLYFVVVIVAETAQTGVPFGKRFNSVWAPLRLVIAIGLLVPVGNGLNTAQYIVLYAAKYGSNFATNGWLVFNSKLTSGHLVEGMIAKPQKPELNDLLRFMMLAHACKALEEGYFEFENKPDKTGCLPAAAAKDETDTMIHGYLVKSGDASTNSLLLENTDYTTAFNWFGNTDMTIRFGDRGCTENHTTQKGNVRPLCGELTLSMVAIEDAGALAIQEGYYELIRHLWGEYKNAGQKEWTHNGFCDDNEIAKMFSANGNKDFKIKSLFYVQKLCPEEFFYPPPSFLTAPYNQEPTSDWVNVTTAGYLNGDTCDTTAYPGLISPPLGSSILNNVIAENIIRKGVKAQADDMTGASAAKYQIPVDQLARGWAGAGMWYNHIASINGTLSGAAWKTPQISRWPLIQTNILIQKKMNNEGSTVGDMTAPNKGKESAIQTERGSQEVAAAGALYRIDMAWMGASMGLKPKSGNFIFNALNWLFGTQGLFDLKDPVNQTAHPLALMKGLGSGLVEASIRNLGLALGGQIGQIFAGEELGPALGGASSMLYTVATMTLTAGFLLNYVLPFFPFVYFFFAVGNWIKGIFEALVGVPLWALAHIRIDGDGLPGSAALNGYFLIFEIFLRPILIVFGLIAAVSIFAAMAIVFNSIFDIAVYNVGGTNMSQTVCGGPVDANLMESVRGPIDQFFYTVMYAVIMYIMALSSFKLIDLIPNKIMRWMGATVDTFGDMAGDPAQNLTNYAAIGGSQITESLVGSMQKGVGAVGKGVEGIKKMGD